MKQKEKEGNTFGEEKGRKYLEKENHLLAEKENTRDRSLPDRSVNRNRKFGLLDTGHTLIS